MNPSLQFSGFIALLFFVWSPLGQAEPMDLDTAVQMAAEISGSIKVLTREVSTYHWQPRSRTGLPEVGLVSPQDPQGLRYIEATTEMFWFNLPSGNMMGNGIYVATDPLASQSFGGGGDQWALFVVTLKAGTRVLDVRDAPTFSSALRGRFAALNCPSWATAEEVLAGYRGLPSELCAGTFHHAFRILGVQAVAYNWGGANLTACTLRNQGNSPAMVLSDPKLAKDVRILVKDIPVNDPKEIHDLRIRVTHFYHLYKSGFIYGYQQDPWPSLSASERPADIVEWIQSHTYFCDSTNWEDLIPSQLFFSSAELVEKKDEIDEKTTNLTEKTGWFVDPKKFRSILAAEYFPPEQLLRADNAALWNAPPFVAWLKVKTEQMIPVAEGRLPLSVSMLLDWARGLTSGPGAKAPELVADRAGPLAALLSELNAVLLHPSQASARDKRFLRDTDALIHAYHERFVQLAPLTAFNDRLARAVVDHIATIRGWPPVLIRTSVDEVSSLGALKAVLMMDKCLDQYANVDAELAPDCEMLGQKRARAH